METTQKFDQWVINKGTFYRAATPASEWFSVRVKDGAVEVASYGKYPMEQVQYSSLGKAIDAVDTHIANYYPQPKTAEERLKDAEAEIVTLKAKVAELERDGFKFEIGQYVKCVTDSNWAKPHTVKGRRVRASDGVREYTRLYDVWYTEDQFTAA